MTGGKIVPRDRFGVAVEAASEEAVRVLDDAVLSLVRLAGDPGGLAERAAGLDPSLCLAVILSAYLLCYGTSGRESEEARRSLEALEPSSTRERAHLAAARSWASGRLEEAAAHLEAALLEDPRDLLALKVAQDLYLSLGDRVQIRDVAARVLPAWPAEAFASGLVRAMHAYGLEECGEYAAALDQARRALEADPEDVWAAHAVLHVHEMEGRPGDGLGFVEDTSPRWAGSFFATHNWWHAALYDLTLGDDQGALGRYDGPIHDAAGTISLAIQDAASLLWRLSLVGAGGRERAGELADRFEATVGDSTNCFADWHAAMAFSLAGRPERCAALVASLAQQATGTNQRVAEAAGIEVIAGLADFALGRSEQAVERLVAARPRAFLLGGSHAQRDALDLTLLAAASSSGQHRLVRALLAERAARSAAAAELGQRVAEANRPPRRGRPGPSSPAVGADALDPADEMDLLEEEASELGVGWRGRPCVERRAVATPEGEISALVWGDRPPEAVLLHGVALNAHSFDAVALALKAPVAALDLPGHGRSAWREDARYHTGALAPSVARAIAALAGRPTTVVGHSLGGLVAIEATRLDPGLVSRLVLVDISPGLRPARSTSVRSFLDGPQVFSSREEIVERALRFGYGRSRAALERGVFHNTIRRSDGTVVWRHHIGQLAAPGEAPPAEQPPPIDRLWAPLQAFPGEVLLVFAEDGFLGEEGAEELRRRLPSAVSVRVPGGHNVQEAQPMRLAAILDAFLEHRLGAGRPGRDW